MHEKFLLLALEQARLGRGFCGPNPSVGAIAVKEDKVMAKAHHRGAGTPHAEQLIIDLLPANESGVTLYVTLEPCNHHGKTPPCVDAIIRYGFEKVVFAYRDPNPIVAKNDSTKILRSNNITVLHYTLSKIDTFYHAYHYWLNTKRPWVVAKIAQSFDGKIGRTEQGKFTLTNQQCLEYTHHKRFNSDIILTTARTITIDNPEMNVRLFKKPLAKPLAILDRQLTLTGNENIFKTAHHCHIFYDQTLQPPASRINTTFHPAPLANDKQLSLAHILEEIGQLGFHEVWVEAGGCLFTNLHNENLVHTTYIYIAPIMMGTSGVNAYQHHEILQRAHKVAWLPMEDNLIAVLDWHSRELEKSCSLV